MIIQFSYQEEERSMFLQLFLLISQHNFLEGAVMIEFSDYTVEIVGLSDLESVWSSDWQSFELNIN